MASGLLNAQAPDSGAAAAPSLAPTAPWLTRWLTLWLVPWRWLQRRRAHQQRREQALQRLASARALRQRALAYEATNPSYAADLRAAASLCDAPPARPAADAAAPLARSMACEEPPRSLAADRRAVAVAG